MPDVSIEFVGYRHGSGSMPWPSNGDRLSHPYNINKYVTEEVIDSPVMDDQARSRCIVNLS